MAIELTATSQIEKKKSLEKALTEIERTFGKGSIMRMGKHSINRTIETIPTGSIGLDLALGIGGIPKGRVIEIYGPEASGKTTVALHIIAEVQKLGGTGAFIDAEHALDPTYAKALGVDIDSLLISQPDTGEQALEITEALVRSNAVNVIVVDSVAALVPKAEIEGEMGAVHMGLQARLMSQALRKLTGAISKTQCVIIFINQLREKIGVMFGSPEVTSGGRALKFFSSIRLDIRRIESIKSENKIVGNHIRVKVVKNKLAPPFRTTEFDIMYGEGISKMGELIDLGIECELVNKSGSWFFKGEKRLGQGRDSAKKYFMDHPEDASNLEREIRIHGHKSVSKANELKSEFEVVSKELQDDSLFEIKLDVQLPPSFKSLHTLG
ncbi:recombinase RecA [Paenibacillus sp. FSL E2-0178]|uniref:recombinase RecA n=1 Tax=Paenibacillus sp. FSL E2-0178 TaxID=2921361 RepID=UPI0031593D29